MGLLLPSNVLVRTRSFFLADDLAGFRIDLNPALGNRVLDLHPTFY